MKRDPALQQAIAKQCHNNILYLRILPLCVRPARASSSP